jgi:hypothetical protein
MPNPAILSMLSATFDWPMGQAHVTLWRTCPLNNSRELPHYTCGLNLSGRTSVVRQQLLSKRNRCKGHHGAVIQPCRKTASRTIHSESTKEMKHLTLCMAMLSRHMEPSLSSKGALPLIGLTDTWSMDNMLMGNGAYSQSWAIAGTVKSSCSLEYWQACLPFWAGLHTCLWLSGQNIPVLPPTDFESLNRPPNQHLFLCQGSDLRTFIQDLQLYHSV